MAIMALMIRVTISQLKNQLCRYLRAVRGGEVVEVLDRNTPVARILPSPVTQEDKGGTETHACRAFFEEQARLGILRQGTGILPKDIVDTPPPGKPGVLAALIAERRRGR
jgi:prevent-host-death family protein